MAQADSVHSTLAIDEVEVRATALRRSASDYTITSEDFSRLNINDLGTALRRLPGVVVKDYGGAGGMKTVSVRGLGSTHTAVALDGLLLSDGASGQIDLQPFALAEVGAVELSVGSTVEIFQPARNFTRAGVANIVPAPGSGRAKGLSASVEGGSWDYWGCRVSGDQAIRRSGDHGMRLSGVAGFTHADNDYPFTIYNGVDTHDERRANSAMQQGFVDLSGEWDVMRSGEPGIRRSGTLKARVRLNDSDRELPGVVRYYTNTNDETLRDRGALAQLQYDGGQGWLRYKSSLRWALTDQDYHNGIPSGGITSERYINREYYATASVMGQWAIIRSCRAALAYSADYWHNNLSTTLSKNPNPKRDSFVQALSAQLGVTDLVSRPSAWGFTAQVINSRIDEVNDYSPVLSARYKWLTLTAKQSLRMPTMTELYYYHIGTQTLEPEYTKQLNLRVLGDQAIRRLGRFQVTLDVYINEVSNKIVAIPYNMFVWRYMNIARVVGKGVDLMAQWEQSALGGELIATVNYSLQSATTRPTNSDYSPSQIAYTPLHSGSGTIAYEGWLSTALTLTAASNTWTTNEHNSGTRIAGYGELSWSIYRRFTLRRNSSLFASLSVNKQLNHQYEIVAHYPMPRRNFRINLTYNI